MLGEVEETIYTVDEEDEGGNGEVRTVKKQSEMLFVRGMWICVREKDGEQERLTLSIQVIRLSSFRRNNNLSLSAMARNTNWDHGERFRQHRRRTRSKAELLHGHTRKR